jgi:hypothetical protein
MKLTLLSSLSTLALLSGLGGCSGDDTEDASGGASGSGGTGTGGTGTAGTGTGGTGTAGTGTGGTGTAGTGTGGSASGSGGTGGAAGSASGNGGAGGGAAGGGSDSPSDTSQAGIEAFLAAREYRSGAWVSDVPAPRDKDETSSPHNRVQVWFNGTLRAGKEETPRPPGSMIVKELYDSADTLAGHAVMVRSTATTNQWIYYCVANEDGRCASGSMANTPSYSLGTGVCSCHGAGTVITPIPLP